MEMNRGSNTGSAAATASVSPLLLASIVAAILMFALSAWAWMQLPGDAQIPVHWGIDGQPDRYGGKFEGLLLTPLLFVGVIALFAVIPHIEPRRAHLLSSHQAYRAVWWVMLLFFGGLHVVLILNVLGYPVGVGRFVPLGVGVMFLVIGRYMGRIRSNFLFGIRTPWTLTSERSWQRTHMWGGRLFMLLGALLAITGLFPLSGFWFGLLMGGVLVMVVGLFVYSYLVWRDDPDANRQE